MSFLKKINRYFMIFILSLSFYPINVFAGETPTLNKLTPNLQHVIMKYAEYKKSSLKKVTKPVEIIAESHVSQEHIKIDGSYCFKETDGWRVIRPKLTNEDIESLNNLKKMEALTLSNFDLTEVDVTKFLDIDTDKKMIFLCLSGCKFDKDYDEIRRMLRRDGYIVGDGPEIWITWPGIDPDDIFLRGRLGGQK